MRILLRGESCKRSYRMQKWEYLFASAEQSDDYRMRYYTSSGLDWATSRLIFRCSKQCSLHWLLTPWRPFIQIMNKIPNKQPSRDLRMIQRVCLYRKNQPHA
jgi:hypothetical protein